MARFLICTLPLVGHVNSAFPIARELVRRGHSVMWYTGAEYQAKVEMTGASFTPFVAALDHEPEQSDPNAKPLQGLASLKHGIKHFFIDSAPGQMQDLQVILQKFPADVVLADATMPGPGWWHEMGGPVWASFGHIPMTLSSRDVAPFGLAIMPDASFMGQLRNRGLNFLLKHIIFRDVISYTNGVRARQGLAAKSESPTDGMSPYLYLQGTVPGFEYPRSDLPAHVHFVGPFLPDRPTNFVAPSWWPELQAGRKVVHVTQGTLSNDPDQLLLPTIAALADEDVLVVATTGGRPLDSLNLENLPANVRLAEFIPHYELLPFVDVMVTNGGYNGVHIALAHGVPVIAAGTTEDKPEVANRVVWSGVGINLKTQTPSLAQIREAVKTVLTEARYRDTARRFQAEFAEYNAPVRAAELLEQLARTRQPVTELVDTENAVTTR